MKIRNGFVSNSSSSSFLLLGTPIAEADYARQDLNQYQYVAILSGDYAEYGYMLVEPDEEMLAFMQQRMRGILHFIKPTTLV